MQKLVAPDLSETEEQVWTDKYVEMMGEAQNLGLAEVDSFMHILA